MGRVAQSDVAVLIENAGIDERPIHDHVIFVARAKQAGVGEWPVNEQLPRFDPAKNVSPFVLAPVGFTASGAPTMANIPVAPTAKVVFAFVTRLLMSAVAATIVVAEDGSIRERWNELGTVCGLNLLGVVQPIAGSAQPFQHRHFGAFSVSFGKEAWFRPVHSQCGRTFVRPSAALYPVCSCDRGTSTGS